MGGPSQPVCQLCARHAKHITSLVPLNSNNPMGHMPIVVQLVGTELGLESDVKPGIHKQCAMLTLRHQSCWPRVAG